MTSDNNLRVEVASQDALDVRSFSLRMRMSELFRIEVEAVSTNPNVAIDRVIGLDATFTIRRGRSDETYTGLCIEMEQVRVDDIHGLTIHVSPATPSDFGDTR